MAKKKSTQLNEAPRGPVVFRAEGVELIRLQHDGVSPPCAIYNGEAPKQGNILEFTLENGVTYIGTVLTAIKAGEQVLVEFVSGIKPV